MRETRNHKVLLLENIHADAAQRLRDAGFTVRTETKALSERALTRALKGVSVLGVRSKTKVTRQVIEEADSLLAVGNFCIGTANVDQNACMDRGIATFNAPYSNTRSVAELVIGEVIMLRRSILAKSMAMHAGRWDKSSAGSEEVRGKRLGIIGYGNIGGQVGILAEALGMEVLYYDILEKLNIGNARRCRSMRDLLRKADIVTLHVDDDPRNAGLIGEREFRAMKPGVTLINLSRGKVVDLKALSRHMRKGKVSGAALDVFPKEPRLGQAAFRNSLRGLSNVILTPHIGGSTIEAQRNIASYVSDKVSRYVSQGNTLYSVNFPQVDLPVIRKFHRVLHIHKNVPGVLSQINTLLAKNGINITGQHLKTNDRVGYAITDIARKYNSDVITAMRSIPETIRLRVLY